MAMFDRLRYPASIFYVANLLGLAVIHVSSTGAIPMRIAGLFLFGFAVGFCVQILVREAVPLLRISMASFWAAFTLWLPVVLVTYGFALMGIPILIAYGAVVGLGAYAAGALNRRSGRGVRPL